MSIKTRDTFRPVERGGVTIDVNSKMATSDRFVDRSRLRRETREEYVPPKGPSDTGGRFVRTTTEASIQDNARRGSDAMKHNSSFSNQDDAENSNGYGECCPSPYYGGGGPLTRKRGDA